MNHDRDSFVNNYFLEEKMTYDDLFDPTPKNNVKALAVCWNNNTDKQPNKSVYTVT